MFPSKSHQTIILPHDAAMYVWEWGDGFVATMLAVLFQVHVEIYSPYPLEQPEHGITAENLRKVHKAYLRSPLDAQVRNQLLNTSPGGDDTSQITKAVIDNLCLDLKDSSWKYVFHCEGIPCTIFWSNISVLFNRFQSNEYSGPHKFFTPTFSGQKTLRADMKSVTGTDKRMCFSHEDGNHFNIIHPKAIEPIDGLTNMYFVTNVSEVEGDGGCFFVAFLRQLEVGCAMICSFQHTKWIFHLVCSTDEMNMSVIHHYNILIF